MVESLHHKLGFSKERVELMVPLAATFVRAAPILFFAMAAVFVAQIYSHSLTLMDLLLILVLAIEQGFASLGLRGQQKLALLAVICNPLGLPNEAVLMLLLAVEPICEILGSVTLVTSQCASVAMVCNKPVRI
jgi:Na+/H+-dicarboxylate symporter